MKKISALVLLLMIACTVNLFAGEKMVTPPEVQQVMPAVPSPVTTGLHPNDCNWPWKCGTCGGHVSDRACNCGCGDCGHIHKHGCVCNINHTFADENKNCGCSYHSHPMSKYRVMPKNIVKCSCGYPRYQKDPYKATYSPEFRTVERKCGVNFNPMQVYRVKEVYRNADTCNCGYTRYQCTMKSQGPCGCTACSGCGR